MQKAKVQLLSAGLALALVFAGGEGRAANASPVRPLFLVTSYGGKCLDYGPRFRGDRSLAIYLNDCAVAHPIGVQEIDDRHDVVLYAGTDVIGIHNPDSNTTTTTGAGTAQAPAEYALELQPPPGPLQHDLANQVFILDGDSIILASSRPCSNSATATVLCPPPPPEMVVQIQHGRGADGSPLVVGSRNLASYEFWDFSPVDDPGGFPTSGFVRVATSVDLWNALCTPRAKLNGGQPIVDDAGQPDDGQLLVGCSSKAAPGSVIYIDDDPNGCRNTPDVAGPCIDMSAYPSLVLSSGVTLRGGRRATAQGAQLFAAYVHEREAPGECPWCMLQVEGDYVRVTGLRLHGQSRDMNTLVEKSDAIEVEWPTAQAIQPAKIATTTQYIATIDHNDISDWENATVEVNGPYDGQTSNHTCFVREDLNGSPRTFSQSCSCTIFDPVAHANVTVDDDPVTLSNVRIERNFMHNNERWGGGYGSVMSSGGRAVVLGNTYMSNRHAIASSGDPHNEYRAWYNLVLSAVPAYSSSDSGSIADTGRQQDFDMHGTGENSSNSSGYGWTGGFDVDIAGNTFLGGNRFNFELRGHPCHAVFFRDNGTQQGQTDGAGTINFHDVGDPDVPLQVLGPDLPRTPVGVPTDVPTSEVIDENNQFGNSNTPFPNPAAKLSIGDFDGDGVTDLFMATGTAWYYSPGGMAEWRFLNAQSYRTDELLFGDFDGDGRTDIVMQWGSRLLVSWGGESDWEVLNPGPIKGFLNEMAVGKFVDRPPSDKRDDIFLADGHAWSVSAAGAGPFEQVGTSSFGLRDVLLGNFVGDGKTDVMGIVAGKWQVSDGARGAWAPLPVSLTSKMDGLVAADFNGDGRSDIATTDGSNLMVSFSGSGPWSRHNVSGCSGLPWTLQQVPIGHFQGGTTSEILLWNQHGLCIVDGMSSNVGLWTLQSWSRQDMQ